MKTRTAAILLVSATLVMAACSGDDPGDDGTATTPAATGATTTDAASPEATSTEATTPDATATEEAPAEVATGPGVTDDTITMGMLTDLTAVFGAQGRTYVAADEMFWNGVNEQGGVCGRQIETIVRDHGYDPQQAVAAYQEIQPNILALHHVLGSPVQAALLPLIAEDDVAMQQVGWSSAFTDNPTTMITGTSYDIQMIIGLQYLMDQGLVSEGDTVGHVYFEGDFGENSLRGSLFAAEQLGLEIIEARITPAVQDLTTQVTQFANAGATAILLSAASPQLSGVANAQQALDFNVPIMGQVPTFVPSLLDDPAMASHLTEYYYMSTPITPLGADVPEVAEVAEAFTAAYPDVGADVNVVQAYASGTMFVQALTAACEAGDLTRPAFLEQLASLSGIETPYATPLSYAIGEPSGTSVFIARTSADVVGGLVVAEEDVTSDLLDQYELPSGE